MQELLRQDGLEYNYIYTSGSYATNVFYEVYDLDTGEYLQGGKGANSESNPLDYAITLDTYTTEYDRNIKIEIVTTTASGATSEIKQFSLIRPYASVSRIKELADIDSSVAGDSEVEKLERRARLAINSYIGFDFYKKNITLEVYGSNTDILTIHDNIIRVDNIYEDDILIYNRYESNNAIGFPIEISFSKNRIKIVNTSTNNKEIFESPKFSVFDYRGVFKKDYSYKINGVFGFDYVPADVEEATALLVDYYLCNDYNIRNKGIAELKNDSYSLKYGPNGFTGTGNIMVDGLLSNYREIKYMVI